jgi:thiol-disulfide isomerase/thioredoxin
MAITRNTKITLVVLVLILIAAAAFTWYVLHTAEEPSTLERTMLQSKQSASFVGVDGSPVDLSRVLQNEVPVIVSTWASWCPSCRAHLEVLQSIAAEQGNSIEVIAINRNESKHNAERFLRTVGPLPDVTTVIDAKDSFYADIDGYAMPETVIYNAYGEPVAQLRGKITSDDITESLADMK